MLRLLVSTDSELQKAWQERDVAKFIFLWLASTAAVAVASAVLGLAMMIFTPTKPGVALELALGIASISGMAMLFLTIPMMILQKGFPKAAPDSAAVKQAP